MNADDAHMWRRAQAARFLAYCEEQEVDAREVMNGSVRLDLSPILDERGKIKP